MNNKYVFSGETVTTTKAKMKISTLLPEYFQTAINKNFINSTYETLFSENNSEYVTGYVGERPVGIFNASRDFYINEVTKDRQNYQLVPQVHSDDKSYVQRYSDIINKLHFHGSNIDSHERLLRQDFYSFSPMIDINKFVNFNKYFWVEKGPKTINFYQDIEGINTLTSEFTIVNHKLETGDTITFSGNLPNSINENVQYLVKVIDQNSFSIYENATDLQNNDPVDFATFFFSTTSVNYQTDFTSVVGKQYATIMGITLQNGMIIRTRNDITNDFNFKRFIIEGVGESIQLLEFDEFLGYDSSPYDTQPYDYDETSYISDPTNIDYVTMQRGQIDKNPWSMRNRWFHESILTDIEKEAALRANKPIIEFVRNIQLYNFGSQGLGKVDVVYDLGDIQSETGKSTLIIDGVEVFNTMRVLVINDEDETRNNSIYEVFGVGSSITFNLLGTLNDMDSVLVTNGTTYSNQYLYLTNNTVVNGQNRVSSSQDILFQLYDYSGIELDNDIVYPESTFTGSKLFSYKIDQSEPVDKDIQRPVVTNEFGDIVFVNNLDVEQYSYVTDFVQQTITGSYYFKHNVDFRSHWHKSDMKVNQAIIDEFVLDMTKVQNIFELSQIPTDNVIEQPVSIEVFFNGILLTKDTDYIFSDQFGNSVFSNTNYIRISDTIVNGFQDGDHLKIYTYSADVPQQPISGYYEVPTLVGITSNPDNIDISELSRNQIFEHFTQMIIRQTGFEGESTGQNNLNNISFNYARGNRIVQNESSITKTAILNSNEFTDISNALRYSQKEYVVFYRKFDHVVQDLSLNGYDKSVQYSQWMNEVFNIINVGKNESFPFASSTVSGYGHIPPSPSQLGILPIHIPHVYYDAQLSTPRFMIKKHDGQIDECRSSDFSVTDTIVIDPNPNNNVLSQSISYAWEIIVVDAFGNTLVPNIDYELEGSQRVNFKNTIGTVSVIYIQSIVDKVKLYFENEIYQSSDFTQNTYKPVYDFLSVKPNFFKDNDYNLKEYNAILEKHFNRWLTFKGFVYNQNVIYDPNNPLTWNYTGTITKDGSTLSGSWRAVFDYYYNCQTPNITPWEILGLSEKPDWWVSEYGPAPYTAQNTKLWNDIRDGVIRNGVKAGTYSTLAKSNIYMFMPVDDLGNILNIETIFGSATNTVFAKQDWKFGDMSPFEFEWRNSRYFPIALVHALYELSPAKIVEYFWEPENNVVLFDTTDYPQYVNAQTYKRFRNSELVIHDTIASDGSLVTKFGIQRYIVAYANYQGKTPEFVKSLVNTHTVSLTYSYGGFVDKQNTNFFADNFGLVPPENITNKVHKSSPIDNVVYTGIIVTRVDTGYQITGYDSEHRKIEFYAPDVTSLSQTLNVGGTQAPIFEWEQNVRFQKGTYVKVDNKTYRATADHRQTTQFNNDTGSWQSIDNVPMVGGISVKKYSKASNLSSVNYDYISSSTQELFDIFYGYQLFLEEQGFIFDTSDNLVTDFETLAKELFIWILENPVNGDTRVFSPFAQKFVFANDNVFVDNLNDFIQDQQSIVQNNGTHIQDENLIIFRENGRIEVTVDQSQFAGTINRIRLKTVEIEHIALFDKNTNFGDIILDPVTSIYQSRFRVNMLRSKDWDGSFKADGFIIANDTIVSNVDKNAQDFQRFYDDDEILPTNFSLLSKKLVGFQNRAYFTNLQIDVRDSFKFYNGFLKDKGTSKAVNKLLRNNFVQNVSNIQVNEEWALKIGEYGATESYSDIVLNLRQKDFRQDYQVVTFIDGTEDDPRNSIIEIYKDDPRFIFKRKSEYNKNTFHTSFLKPQMPYAGYPLLSESDIYALKLSNSSAQVLQTYIGPINNGIRFWVADVGNNDWNIYRLVDTSVTVASGTLENGVFELVVNDSSLVTLNSTVFFDKVLKCPMKVIQIGDSTTIKVQPFGEISPVEISEITTAKIFDIEPIRFTTLSDFDNYTPSVSYTDNDIFFIDNVNGKYRIINRNKTPIRIEQPKVDYSQFVNAAILTEDNVKLVEVDTYHPNLGIFPSSVNTNLDFITPFDPVDYNKDQTIWTNQKLGSIWWNIDDVRFIDYDQSDELYRTNNWGKVFPAQSISVYQWIKSPVLPSRWSEFLDTEKGKSIFSLNQTPLNTTDYITQQQYNDRSGSFENVYFFWVKDNENIFDTKFNRKTISTNSIRQILLNPTKQGIRWVSPIDIDSFIIQNVTNELSDTSKLVMTFKDFKTDNKIHSEWYLFGDKTEGRNPPSHIFDKVKHSLCGFVDIKGTQSELFDQGISLDIITQYTIENINGVLTVRIPVPDENIVTTSKYGSKFRPRQSWFSDVVMSRQAFIHSTNKLMKRTAWVDTESDWASFLYIEDPEPETFDYKVASLFDRDTLVNEIGFTSGKMVLVENDISLDGRWSLWIYNGSSFDLTQSQGFRMTDYWAFGDYVKEGESVDDIFISKTYTNINDRNADLNNLPVDSYVKLVDMNSIQIIYKVKIDNNIKYFDIIMKENATIEFDYRICTCRFGDNAFSIIYDAFIQELSTIRDRNEFMVDMIQESFRQHKFIDWVFKTSYVDISGIEEELIQKPVFTVDLTDNIIEYFNEVKPYHTKIRGLIDRNYTAMDDLSLQYIDSYDIDTTIYFDRVQCVADTNLPVSEYTHAERMVSAGFDSSYIEGCAYSSYAIDGKEFKFFENIYGVGYDTDNYDSSILGYDYNNNDVETLYDMVINGKTFDTMPDDVKDTIVDGGSFYQPTLSENSPPELVKFRMGDTLSMDVYSMPYNINIEDGFIDTNQPEGYDFQAANSLLFVQRPKMIQDLYLTKASNTYSISQIPQSNDAVFVYLDTVLLDQTEYTINWSIAKPYITLNSPVANDLELKILSYSIGGFATAVFEQLITNTQTTIFDIDIVINSSYEVVTVVNGVSVSNQTQFSGDASLDDNQIKIPSITTGDNVYIVVYDGDKYSDVYTQSFVYNGFVAQITNPSGPIGREEENTIVYKNGIRIPPSYIKYYKFDETVNQIKVNETIYSEDYIKVFIDNNIVPATQYSIDYVTNSILFDTSVSTGAEITVINDIASEFRIDGTDFYLHTKAIADNILTDIPVNAVFQVNSLSTTITRPDNTGIIPVDNDLGDFHVSGTTIAQNTALNLTETVQINGNNVQIIASDTIEDIISKINGIKHISGVIAYYSDSTINLKSNGANFTLSGNWSTSFGITAGNYFNLVTQVQNNIGDNYRVSTVDGRLRIIHRNGNLSFNLTTTDLSNEFGFANSYQNTGVSIKIITMDDNDHNYMKTEVFQGNTLGEYPLYQNPVNNNSTNVSVIKTANLLFNDIDFYDNLNAQIDPDVYGLTYEKFLEAYQSKTTTNDNNDMIELNDFEFTTSDLGYDMYFYGNVYDHSSFNTIQFKIPHYESETVIATTYAGNPRTTKYAFKMLKTLNNKFEYYSIEDDKITTIKQEARPTDTQIHIADYDKLPKPQKEQNTPAYIWVDGEVIGYYNIEQNGSDAIISDIIRGAKGTAFGVYNAVGPLDDKYINIGTKVYNLSDTKFQIVGPPRVPM